MLRDRPQQLLLTDTYAAQEVLDQWARFWEKPDPFTCTVERKIGNTLYVIETECEGAEPLSDKAKRLIFSHKEAI